MPALAAAAGLDAIVIALAASLVVLAVYMLFRPLLAGALAQLPVVGGWLAQHADDLLPVILGAAVGAADAALGPLADLVRRVWAVLGFSFGYVVSGLEGAAMAIWRVRYQVIPASEAAQQAYARQLTQSAVQFTEAIAQQLAQQLTQDIGYVLQVDQQLAQALQAYARQLAQSVLNTAVAGDRAGEEYARQLAQDVLSTAVQDVELTQRYAQQLDQQTLEYVGQVAHTLNLEIVSGVQQAEAYAGQLERIAVDHADQVGAAVGTAAAAATAAVAARVTAIEDSPCQQFCGPLGELGGLLNGLGDAAILALLLGLLQESVAHPDQVAGAIASVGVPIMQDVAGSFQLGIPAR